MLKTKLPKGMIFENVAKLGSKPNWRIVPAPEGWGNNFTQSLDTRYPLG